MEKRGISQYDLYMNYGIHRSLLDRLRHNKNIETFTLNKLCTILNCDLCDIAEYIPDETDTDQNLWNISWFLSPCSRTICATIFL